LSLSRALKRGDSRDGEKLFATLTIPPDAAAAFPPDRIQEKAFDYESEIVRKGTPSIYFIRCSVFVPGTRL
jgi:hypothetical protein